MSQIREIQRPYMNGEKPVDVLLVRSLPLSSSRPSQSSPFPLPCFSLASPAVAEAREPQVAHGLILRCFVKRWLGFSVDSHLPMTLPPGAIVVLRYVGAIFYRQTVRKTRGCHCVDAKSPVKLQEQQRRRAGLTRRYGAPCNTKNWPRGLAQRIRSRNRGSVVAPPAGLKSAVAGDPKNSKAGTLETDGLVAMYR
jgi:hypothetical protein